MLAVLRTMCSRRWQCEIRAAAPSVLGSFVAGSDHAAVNNAFVFVCVGVLVLVFCGFLFVCCCFPCFILWTDTGTV